MIVLYCLKVSSGFLLTTGQIQLPCVVYKGIHREALLLLHFSYTLECYGLVSARFTRSHYPQTDPPSGGSNYDKQIPHSPDPH